MIVDMPNIAIAAIDTDLSAGSGAITYVSGTAGVYGPNNHRVTFDIGNSYTTSKDILSMQITWNPPAGFISRIDLRGATIWSVP